MHVGSWRINVSYGVKKKKKKKKNFNIEDKTSLMLFVNKNEDTFFSCYLYVKFLFF